MTTSERCRFSQEEARAQRSLAPAPFQQKTLPDGTPWILLYRQGNDYLLRFPELADFEIAHSGREARCWPVPGVQPATVQNLFHNQVLPLALSRQGKLVLHASAVELGGRSVAFVGVSGRGKSTLAASFATSGTAFLTDDGLQLEWRDERLLALPSQPSIRLWADSQLALIAESVPSGPAVEYTTKARFLAGHALAFCPVGLPLAALYFLGEGEASGIFIGRMKSSVALMELVRHSFLLDIDIQEMLADHFDELSKIANLAIHYHLDYPRRFDELPEVRKAVIAHMSK
jgi:hypothetical protein